MLWLQWILVGLITGTALSVPVSVSGEKKPAAGRLLVAHERLSDPNFSRSVVLLVSYDVNGAIGVVLNRPSDAKLEAAFPDIEELRSTSHRLYRGGPVAANRLLMLLRATKPPVASRLVFEDVYVCGDRDMLRVIARRKGAASRFRVFAGHAGWAPRQLDAEIARGDWYVASPDANALFETPADELWRRLIDRVSGDWASARHRAE